MQKSSFVTFFKGRLGFFLMLSQFIATLCGVCTTADEIHPSAKGCPLLLMRNSLASRSKEPYERQSCVGPGIEESKASRDIQSSLHATLQPPGFSLDSQQYSFCKGWTTKGWLPPEQRIWRKHKLVQEMLQMKNMWTAGFITSQTSGELAGGRQATSSLSREVEVPHLSPRDAVLQRENSALPMFRWLPWPSGCYT